MKLTETIQEKLYCALSLAKKAKILALSTFGAFCTLSLTQLAQAGVFSIPHLVTSPRFALGLEPELYGGNSTGLGVNLYFTQGVSEINNIIGIVGTGGGPRQFRFGGAYTFDFFPDTSNQPGIGVAAKALFVSIPSGGSLELQGVPYIHKKLSTNAGIDIEPFLAIPLGLTLYSGTFSILSTVALGAQFQQSPHISTIVELGVGLGSSNTYLSGGIVYYN